MRKGIAVVGLMAAAALAALFVDPAAGHAQGASTEYTELSRMEAPGLFGALLRRAVGGEETWAIHVLDGKIRTDDGTTSTIFDAAGRQWTLLDHEARTYMSFSFADLQELAAQMAAAYDEGGANLDAEMEEARAELEEAQRTMEISVAHVARGETQRIHGYSADRHHVVVRIDEVEDVAGAEDVESGSLVVLFDYWLSEELARENPVYSALESDPAFRELGEELAASFYSWEKDDELAAYATVDPRVAAAMGEAFESLAGAEGMVVKSATTVAVLAPGVELETDLLVAWEPATMGAQIRGGAAAAARDAARGAVRGLTRGVLGRGRDPEPAEEDVSVVPLFRLTTEVLDVRSGGSPSPDLFRVPEGYTEAPRPSPSGG